jgi:hypothetical protein
MQVKITLVTPFGRVEGPWRPLIMSKFTVLCESFADNGVNFSVEFKED